MCIYAIYRDCIIHNLTPNGQRINRIERACNAISRDNVSFLTRCKELSPRGISKGYMFGALWAAGRALARVKLRIRQAWKRRVPRELAADGRNRLANRYPFRRARLER